MLVVLIIDDSEIIRSTLADLLTWGDTNIRILHARNGQEGIDLALAEMPDVILLDGLMPILDGHETARILRELPETKSIPLIAITSEIHLTPMAVGLRALCDDSLLKPFTLDELKYKIARATESQILSV